MTTKTTEKEHRTANMRLAQWGVTFKLGAFCFYSSSVAGQWDLNDGKENKKDFWYKFYFYDKKKNEIMFTWTRPAGQSKTTFAFVSINKGLDLGHWEYINDDFGFFENRKIKKDFEETILKKIKENLDNN